MSHAVYAPHSPWFLGYHLQSKGGYETLVVAGHLIYTSTCEVGRPIYVIKLHWTKFCTSSLSVVNIFWQVVGLCTSVQLFNLYTEPLIDLQSHQFLTKFALNPRVSLLSYTIDGHIDFKAFESIGQDCSAATLRWTSSIYEYSARTRSHQM